MTTEERVDGAAQAPASVAGPGAQLQAAREAAGLSLEQVAAQLPGRTFARGFVRNYARLLNLDGDLLLAGLPDSARVPALEAPALQSTGAMIAELPSSDRAQPGFSRWVIPIVLIACIVAAATYEWYRGALAPPSEPKHAALAAAVALSTTSTELANPLAAEPKADAAVSAPAPHAADPEPAAAPKVAPAPEAAPAPVAAPVAAAESAAALQLRYRGPSWTEIRDRDGQVLISRLVSAGSEQSIRGSAPFDIVIGNANEVTLVYRGAQVDLSRYTRQNVARLRLT
jgi:cytoskeleton protein RodZ